MKTEEELRDRWKNIDRTRPRRGTLKGVPDAKKEPTEEERLRSELETWLSEKPCEKLIAWHDLEARRANARAHMAATDRDARYAMGQEAAHRAVADLLRTLRGSA